MIIKNGYVVFDEEVVRTDIKIDGERIAGLGRFEAPPEETIEASGMYVFPGLIDAHVHFREPGLTHKEDFLTGTRAALSGGVTTILDMPNTKPPTTTVRLMREKRMEAKGKALCDFGLHMGATNSNFEEVKNADPLSLKIFMGSTTGDLLVSDYITFTRHFALFKANRPICVHAEDEKMLEKFREKKARYWNAVRPPVCEHFAIGRALRAAENAMKRVHVCHITTPESVEMVASAKNRGVRATCEVTPHHLLLNECDEEKLGGLGRVNPPLRSRSEQAKLWGMMHKIDLIASDHAPHTLDEKESDEPPSGMPGVETLFPLMLDSMGKGRITPSRLMVMTAKNPARIFGIPMKGEIRPHYYADLVLVDMNERYTIKSESLFTKCGWSPFEGRQVRGRIKKVFLRGELVFDGEQVIAKPGVGKTVEELWAREDEE